MKKEKKKMLTINFKKVLTPLLWKMEKTIKTLITFFFSFLIKTFFKWIVNYYLKGKIIRYSWSTINVYFLLSHEWWVPL